MRRRSSNPQTPHPIWKDICPCKSSVWRLTLSNSSVVDFYPLTHDFNLTPELLLWQALFFSTIDLCRYLLLRRRGCDFCKIWFWYPSLCRFHRPFFLWLSFRYLGVCFPNSGFVSNSNFETSFQDWPSFFSIRRFGNLFPSVPSFRCEAWLRWELLLVWTFMNLRADIQKCSLPNSYTLED